MITSKMNTTVKLTKLFYKYAEDMKKEEKIHTDLIETKKVEDYESYPPYNFSWFIENKIAAMGWPQTVENLNYLVDVGIDHLVTLSPERIPPILECKKKLKWTEIPIKEFGAPTLKQILKFVEFCERAEMRGEVIGIHCRQGRGRTGTMLACYLVYFKNMAPERAVLTIRVQRPGSCETYEQEKVVCHYHDCLRGTIDKVDYRMVDEKEYFDAYLRHIEADEKKESENKDNKDGGEKKDGAGNQDGAEENGEKKEKTRKKTKAMVINHKIYF